MKHFVWLTFILPILILSCKNQVVEPKPKPREIHMVPLPNQVQMLDGTFELNDKTSLYANGAHTEQVARYLRKKISQSTGFALPSTGKPAGNTIILQIDSTETSGEEGYSLKVTPDRVVIKSVSPRGLFYGVQTLLQLLPPEVESPSKVENINWEIPAVKIVDQPRFKWRGMHLDVCRHFFPVDFIKKQLDLMAMYKLNTFHWHLTEDQGWRIEIKKYPELTRTGAYRIDEGKRYGGYYTQDEIKEIVDYAAERFINVVPEIEMPGHSLAALASYPELSCTGGPFKVRNYWGVEPNIYCAGNDKVFEFLEDVIEEVVDLFPYRYFHIGGDEAPKTKWEQCPKCQQRIKEEGLKDEHELQSYFIKRVEKILLKHGRQLVGWDEILEGGLAPSATVMSWRGEKGGIEAAAQGHDVVMTPGNWVYLDHYQGSPKVEPVAIGGYTLLKESYEYEPVPAELPPGKQKHILGTQGNVWTEYMYTPPRAEYSIYPRIIALAEVNWTQPAHKNFDDFLKRMNNQFVRLDLHDVNYHIPLPEGPENTYAFTNEAELAFGTTRPVTMYYTLDGSEPGPESPVYNQPLTLDRSATLKIRTALPTGKMSMVRNIRVLKQQPLEPVEIENKTPGLNMSVAEGEIYSTADLNSLKNWKEYDLKDAKQFRKMFDLKHPSAAIMTGWFYAPQDGIYRFSTEMDEFHIGGKLLISNDGEVKKFSRNDASVALKKGYYPVKIIFINNIVGGWPSIWNGFALRYKIRGTRDYVKLHPGDFVH